MKIAFSPRAVADLTAIADYLVERSPQGVMAIERRIRDVVERLAEFPSIGRRVMQRPGVRVMPLGRYPYLIFYTAVENELVVLHVRHASRRPVGEDEL
jgi:toxin ParE1/3/4